MSAGGFGRFQKMTLFLIILPALMPTGFFNFNVMFMSATPDSYGCTLPTYSNLTIDDLQPLLPKERRGGKNTPLVPSRCSMYDLNYTDLDFGSIRQLINQSDQNPIDTVPCDRSLGFTYSTAVYESTTVTDWNLVCDYRDVLNSLQFSASTIGGCVLNKPRVFKFWYTQHSKKDNLNFEQTMTFLICSVA